MRSCLIIMFGLWMMLKTDVNADIVTDGTLGNRVILTGDTLSITPELGQRAGNNLFHSFQEFNLNSHQTATFSGDAGIHSIIARVTGVTSSLIDGTIRSTIPNADLYFVNPNGVLFGQHAHLDISGSFFATTADSLHFQDGAEFSARLSQTSQLSVAPVESFGFLSPLPAPIRVQDAQLAVPEGHTLSLIGGDLYFNGRPDVGARDTPVRAYNLPVDVLTFPDYTTVIKAAAGMVQLISVSAPGKINPLIPNRLLEQGNIRLTQSRITTAGARGGDIQIRSGLLHLHDAQIDSQTLGDLHGGDITIQAKDLILQGNQDFSAIAMNTQGSGLGGNLYLNAENLHIFGGGLIINGTYGVGDSGNTEITLGNRLIVEGKYLKQFLIPSGIISAAYTVKDTAGNGGNITVTAKDIRLSGGGEIVVTTYGSGRSGNIKVTTDNFLAHGVEKFPNESDPGNPWSLQSGIVSNSLAGSDFLQSFNVPKGGIAGNAGNIDILAVNINLENEGLIISDGHQGNAGKIDIRAHSLTLTGLGVISGSSLAEGRSGLINITVNGELSISNEVRYNKVAGGIYTNSEGNTEYSGNGGNVIIHAGKMTISGHSIISSTAKNSNGGDIEITSPSLLYVDRAEITTSTSGNKSNGGNIVVENSRIVVLNGAKLTTQATEGKGGNIRVAAERLIRSPDSKISVSSLSGSDGNISISSPIQDVTQDLFRLSSNFLDLTPLLEKPCHLTNRVNSHNTDDKIPNGFKPTRPALRILSPLKLLRAAPTEWYPSF